MAMGVCDPDVYRRGQAFLVIHEADGAASVESFKDALMTNPSIRASGSRIDWHYVAGHAVFKVIGDRALAIRTAELALTAPTFSRWRWEVRHAR